MKHLMYLSISILCLSVSLLESERAVAQVIEPPHFVLEWGELGSEEGQFSYPWDVAVDSLGNVYVADNENSRIQKFDNDGNFILQWETGWQPQEVLVHQGFLYVGRESSVKKFDLKGAFITETNYRSPYGPWILTGLDLTSGGELWTVNGNPFIDSIVIFNSDLEFLRTLPGAYMYFAFAINSQDEKCYSPNSAGQCGLGFVFDLTFDSADNLYATELNKMYAIIGGQFVAWGEFGTGPGQVHNVHGIAADDNGNIFVADGSNNRIQKFAFGPVAVEPITWGKLKSQYQEN